MYSVGYVSKFVQNIIRQEPFLNEISIKGEVSNCTYQRGSGHLYFTLKDKDGVLKGAMFRGYQASGLKFRLQEGQQVIVTGKIDTYEMQSQYQMIAKTIELDGTGNLYQKLEELKQELQVNLLKLLTIIQFLTYSKMLMYEMQKSIMLK